MGVVLAVEAAGFRQDFGRVFVLKGSTLATSYDLSVPGLGSIQIHMTYQGQKYQAEADCFKQQVKTSSC